MQINYKLLQHVNETHVYLNLNLIERFLQLFEEPMPQLLLQISCWTSTLMQFCLISSILLQVLLKNCLISLSLDFPETTIVKSVFIPIPLPLFNIIFPLFCFFCIWDYPEKWTEEYGHIYFPHRTWSLGYFNWIFTVMFCVACLFQMSLF